ncbi:hypothetical protein [Halorarum salinum]|uniref:Small CPxCG-related zinc finger protein n=1 Tax=Halorarum salinum TaxID=2743089 RepID=A0A7D5QA17_9EURY|nr:hypothetical protein [Halobaculum salinum]QLG61398.1 hypothetical protein HUG12_06480 [Halobaculum salinum]
MPYFECANCGLLADVGTFERTELRQHCPECDEQTTWTVAFDSDRGVSF